MTPADAACTSPPRRRLAAGPALLLLAIAWAIAAVLPAAAQAPAWNPKPAAGDILLPMPGDWQMVFTPVPVAGTGRYGGGERVMEAGAERSVAEAFDFPRPVRIGGNFRRPSGEWFLAFGKYEVTIGQLAVVLGEGNIAKGVEILRERSQIEALKRTGAEQDRKLMARPVHALMPDDYLRFIAAYNDWCLASRPCIEAMKTHLGGIAGFFRLPTETEWEYVARGGVRGMQSKAPLPFPAGEVAEFALVGANTRNLPDEIGQRKPHPLLPIYDLFGNVAELMAGPFTLDNGTGMVGGGVTRGGDYRTSAAALRVSQRTEVPPFYFSSSDKTYKRTRPREVGIRLMIGSVVRIPDIEQGRAADEDIAGEFRSSYVPLAGGGGSAIADLAGNTLRTAKALGAIDPRRPVEVSDSVGGDDPADFFTFSVAQYGNLRIEVTSISGDVSFEMKHDSQEASRQGAALNGKQTVLPLDGLMPGSAWLKVFATRGTEVPRYSVKISHQPQDRAGNTIAEAENLGRIDRPITVAEYVGPGDEVDVYRVSTTRTDTIRVRLLDLTGDANVELYDARERKLAESVNPRTSPEAIDFASAPAGDYFVRVYSKDNKPTLYRLIVSLGDLDTAGDSIATARDLGTLSSDSINIEESLSATDRTDFFKLQLAQTSRIKIQVSKMTANVDVFFYGGDGKLIEDTKKPGIEAEVLDIGANPGTYFIEVRNATTDSTPYSMNIDVRPTTAHSHWDLAYRMRVGASPVTFASNVTNEADESYALLEIATAGMYKVALDITPSDRETDIDLFLYIGRGKPRESVGGPEALREEIVEPLTAGRYMVKMRRVAGKGSASLRLTVEQTREMQAPTLPGRFLSRHGDWEVREITPAKGKKECVAATVATSVAPEQWRGVRPHLGLLVETGDSKVAHWFDHGDFYDSEKTVSAAVVIRTGAQNAIPARFATNAAKHIRSLEPCTQNPREMCVSNNGLRGLTQGNTLVVRGTTRDGRPSEVRYSLQGYQAAIRAMNAACANANHTGWLIKP